MANWFVTRHAGAVEWAQQAGILSAEHACHVVEHLDLSAVQAGDQVIGTLPVNLVARVCQQGARYWHLSMELPQALRGQELSAEQMRALNCRAEPFVVYPGPSSSKPMQGATQQSLHICLVSQQEMANLLPLLKHRPARVALVFTPLMKKALHTLRRCLLHFGFDQQALLDYEMQEASSGDFGLARADARRIRDDLLQRYAPSAWRLVLNATGGTKPISSAFLMEMQGFDAIYTDTQTDSIRSLSDGGLPPEPLGQIVHTLEDFLACKNYAVVRKADAAWENQALALEPVTRALADIGQSKTYLNKFKELQRKVEKAAFHSKRSKFEPEYLKRDWYQQALKQQGCIIPKSGALLELLLAHRLLLPLQSAQPNSYRAANEQAMSYLGGGWLEHWAWLEARTCTPQALAANVGLRWLAGSQGSTASDEENELDLVLLHRNKLLIVECKTVNWRGEAGDRQEIFNKLDALGTHARGLFGQSLLLSAFEPNEKALRRSKNYNIDIITLTAPGAFQQKLRQWMGLKNPPGA